MGSTRTITTACPQLLDVRPAGSAGLPVAPAAAVGGELLDRAHFYGSLEVTRHGA